MPPERRMQRPAGSAAAGRIHRRSGRRTSIAAHNDHRITNSPPYRLNGGGRPMDSDDDGVLEAARAIRPYLNDLVDEPAVAEDLDRRIAEQLAGQAGQTATTSRLRALLGEHEDTAWFMSRVLTDKPHYRPPYQQS